MTYHNSTWRRTFVCAKLALGTAVVAGVMAFSATSHAATMTSTRLGIDFDTVSAGANNDLTAGDLLEITALIGPIEQSGYHFVEFSANPDDIKALSFTSQNPDNIFKTATVSWNTQSDGLGSGVSALIPEDGSSVTLSTSILVGTPMYLIFRWDELAALSGPGSLNALIATTAVPLPAGLLLFLSGLAGIGFLGRYKAKRREPAVA